MTISGTFIVLIAYFVGNAWAKFLPRGDRYEARWRARGGQGKLPTWISVISFFNYGDWNLKEHAVCAITATSASNAGASVTVFAAQDLFYDLPLSTAAVILSTISIGLFGYGICGVLRPIAVWHVEAVYWSTLPTVKTLQGLHWQEVKNSKPLRFFWYSFVGMALYEFFPAYIFPWLNSVSIPCLAAMHATGSKAAVLTNLFGGATNNEGLGLFSLSFDWQYVSRHDTSGNGCQLTWLHVDYVFQHLSTSCVASSCSGGICCMLCRHDCYLLYQFLGCKITAFYVHEATLRKWQSIPCCQGLRWWCA